MSLIGSFIVFFILWWLVLFTILPWGVRPHHEEAETVPGADPGSPQRPRIWLRVVATTVVTAVIWTAIYLAVTEGWVTLDDLPGYRPEKLW